MRQTEFKISKRRNTLILKARWKDSDGRGETTLANLRGWRAEMLKRTLPQDEDSWIEAMKLLVAMSGISYCGSRWGAERLIEAVKAMGLGETFFWASKLLGEEEKAPEALKKLYDVK